jgi:hypothetical protein
VNSGNTVVDGILHKTLGEYQGIFIGISGRCENERSLARSGKLFKDL